MENESLKKEQQALLDKHDFDAKEFKVRIESEVGTIFFGIFEIFWIFFEFFGIFRKTAAKKKRKNSHRFKISISYPW